MKPKASMAAAAAAALALSACVARTAIPEGVPPILANLPGECLALYTSRGPDGFWFGGFHGAREGRSPFGVAGDEELIRTFERRCFADERACRAWLYDQLTENTAFVYSSECRRGLPA